MPSKQIKPTKSEFCILRVLWQKGPGTVREIHATLNESRPPVINSVLRMLPSRAPSRNEADSTPQYMSQFAASGVSVSVERGSRLQRDLKLIIPWFHP